MTDGELTSTCQAVNPAATSTVPVSPHQAAQRLRRPGPGRSSGQRAGTRPSPLTTISTASGAAISSIAAGTNEPPSRSGSPGRNHAITRIAGSTVSLANVTPPADGRGSAVTQRKRRPALAAPVPAAVNRPAHRAIPVVLPVPPALPPAREGPPLVGPPPPPAPPPPAGAPPPPAGRGEEANLRAGRPQGRRN